MIATGECEVAVSARIGCRWVIIRECGKLLYGRRSRPKLKLAVHESYLRPAILHECEAWCLIEKGMGIVHWTDRSNVRTMCGAEFKDRKMIYGFVVEVGLELSSRSFRYGKQYSLAWSGAEERGRSCLEKGISILMLKFKGREGG